MKKIYKTPIVTITKLQTIQMIATSSVDIYGENATEPGMSRRGRRSAWDEEDEDEYDEEY